MLGIQIALIASVLLAVVYFFGSKGDPTRERVAVAALLFGSGAFITGIAAIFAGVVS